MGVIFVAFPTTESAKSSYPSVSADQNGWSRKVDGLCLSCSPSIRLLLVSFSRWSRTPARWHAYHSQVILHKPSSPCKSLFIIWCVQFDAGATSVWHYLFMTCGGILWNICITVSVKIMNSFWKWISQWPSLTVFCFTSWSSLKAQKLHCFCMKLNWICVHEKT